MKELPFRVWARLAAALADRTWRHGNESVVRELLAPHADAAVFLRRKDDGSSCTSDVVLWSGEARAYAAYLSCPSSLPPHEPIRWRTIVASHIGDHLDDGEFLGAAFSRLKALSPYDPDGLPDYPEWHWHCEDGRSNLLVAAGRLILPPGWRYGGHRIGPIFCRTTHVRLIDGQRRMGLVSERGEVTVPFAFAYLSEPDGRGRIVACEAHRTEIPLHSSACDLVDVQGDRLNPAGIEIVPGTLGRGGALVKRAGDGSGRFGWMASDGVLIGDIRWRSVGEFWSELAAVQDAETGLWGYMDGTGKVVIQPAFEKAARFSADRAVASPKGSGGLVGVIDRTGRFVIAPAWKELESFMGDYIHVTAPEGAIGLLDNEGVTVIEPHHPSADVQERIEASRLYTRGHPFAITLGRRLRARVDAALAGAATLAPAAGLMANSGSDFELAFSGLRGRSVVLVDDYRIGEGSRHVKAGERGAIGFSYPASASIFNFTIEAPVEGLESWPQGSIGIPWRLLKLAEPEEGTSASD